jgi:transposase InsO family protein
MSPLARRELLVSIYARYRKAGRREKALILNSFCEATGYHRKYAIQLLAHPPEPQPKARRARAPRYGAEAMRVLSKIWEAAGYPWSVRLKALLPDWLLRARTHLKITPAIEQQLLAMSARTMDRGLRPFKRRLGHRLYGRTKPGSLLKHQIPLQTSSWAESRPGFTEIDLVSHSGNAADGEFLHSLNVTDLATTWVETRAVLGKGQTGITNALAEISRDLPFPLRGIDSDNGSEFINHHLVGFCQQREIQFTRSRPYKKDDNAHIEQKNWTHVRKLLGWDRYDSSEALLALNDLYCNELRLMMNLFQPTVKLASKERVGSRLRRRYTPAQTPLDRLLASAGQDLQPEAQRLRALRETLDPFALSKAIEKKLQGIYSLANSRLSPKTAEPKAA